VLCTPALHGHTEVECVRLADYHTLLRFLRARDYEVSKSCAMYVSHLNWRKENGVDSILEDFTFTERTPYLQVYPQGYFNTDKNGRC